MLTRKQQVTLDIVKQYIQTMGYAPTTQEIAKQLGIRSRGVVHRLFKSIGSSGIYTFGNASKTQYTLVHACSKPRFQPYF